MIITFANQKGGVGKTSLLILFSHFLSSFQKEKVLLIDADHQHSLTNQRKVDEGNFPDYDFPAEIVELNLENPSIVSAYMEELKKADTPILIDAPGNLTEPGLIHILAQSDIIIVPYQYERKVLDSSGTFIIVLEQLRKKLNINPLVYFVPNRIKSVVGLKEEKAYWAEIDQVFSLHGIVTPMIKDLACLSRINTITITKEQTEQVRNCFELIYKAICPMT